MVPAFKIVDIAASEVSGYCKLLAVDSGSAVDVEKADLEEAFDKISQERFLFKLERCGMHSKLLPWIRNYLIGRTLEVRLNDELLINCRFWWGSTRSFFGLFFSVHNINHVQGINKNLLLFADDLQTYRVTRMDEVELQQDVVID